MGQNCISNMASIKYSDLTNWQRLVIVAWSIINRRKYNNFISNINKGMSQRSAFKKI